MMFFNIYSTACFWLTLAATAHSASILAVHPIRARSHFNYHLSIYKSLLDAGHHVTLISPFSPTNAMKNLTHINSRLEESENASPLSAFDFKVMPWLAMMEISVIMVEGDCYNTANLKEVQDILNTQEKKFDVMFVETILMYECYLPLATKLGIPVIGTCSIRSWNEVDRATGNPRFPAVTPFESSSNPSKMSFFQRLSNTYDHVILNWYQIFYEYPKVEKFRRKYFPTNDFETDTAVSLVFVNNHPMFQPRPLVPCIIDVGGIHLKSTANPLPQELRRFIEEAEHGVILFTFGTITKSNTIGVELRNAFRAAFAKIPQRVIWKFDEPIENLTTNVLLSSWLPQEDILGHDNVKAFISHCGINGMYEGIASGKPIIAIPVFADQTSNAAILEELGVGVYLDVLTLTAEKLLHAIDKVMNDTSYRERMQQVSRQFRDRPLSPQEAVVYWTEYVIRYNGTRHLRPAAADMPAYQYLLLDVIFFIIAISLTIILLMGYFLNKIFFFICRSRAKKIQRSPSAKDKKKL